MSHSEGFITQQIKSTFGHTNLYEIFQIPKNATKNEIKKAYMKLALQHHPDKGGNASIFQVISMIHTILSDEEKRKLYDECGLFTSDEDDDNADQSSNEKNFDFWNEYFRNLFPKLTLQAIQSFSKEYIGSKEEEKDLIEAFAKCNGNAVKMMDWIMFAELGEEQRIITTIDRLIEEGKISGGKMNKSYEKGKVKLLKRYEQYVNGLLERFEEEEEEEEGEGEDIEEEEEEEDANEEDEKEKHPTSNMLDTDEEEESNPHASKKRNRKESETSHKHDSSSTEKSTKKMKKQKKSNEPTLEELILAKNKSKSNNTNLFAKIISKYSDGDIMEEEEDEPLPNDEEFEAFQKSLFAKKEKKGSTTSSQNKENAHRKGNKSSSSASSSSKNRK